METSTLTRPENTDVHLTNWRDATTLWEKHFPESERERQHMELVSKAIGFITDGHCFGDRPMHEELLWMAELATFEHTAFQLLKNSKRVIIMRSPEASSVLSYSSEGWKITVQLTLGTFTKEIPLGVAIIFWLKFINTTSQWPTMLHWLYERLDQIAAEAPSQPPDEQPPATE